MNSFLIIYFLFAHFSLKMCEMEYLISAEAYKHLNWKSPAHKTVRWNLKGYMLTVNSASSKSTWYILYSYSCIPNAWLLTLPPLWAVLSPFLDLTSVVVGAVSFSHGYAINRVLEQRLTEGFVLHDPLLAAALRFAKEKLRSSVKPLPRRGLLLLLFILSVTQCQDPLRYLLFIVNSLWYTPHRSSFNFPLKVRWTVPGVMGSSHVHNSCRRSSGVNKFNKQLSVPVSEWVSMVHEVSEHCLCIVCKIVSWYVVGLYHCLANDVLNINDNALIYVQMELIHN
jgi:hypothetical protein